MILSNSVNRIVMMKVGWSVLVKLLFIIVFLCEVECVDNDVDEFDFDEWCD